MLVGTVVSVGILLLTDPGALTEHLIAGAAAGGFLLIAALAYPAGMGMGDVKLAAVMGLFLGRAVGPAMLVALSPARSSAPSSSPARVPRRVARPRSRSAPISRSAGSSGCSPATRSSTGTSTPSSDLKARRQPADKPTVTRWGQSLHDRAAPSPTPTPGPHSMRAVNLLTPELRVLAEGLRRPAPLRHDDVRRPRRAGRPRRARAGRGRRRRLRPLHQRGQGAQGQPRPGQRSRTRPPSSVPPQLKPYADFQTLAQDRASTVQALASARFDWEQSLRDLSRALPVQRLPQLAQGLRRRRRRRRLGPSQLDRLRPALELSGCTRSQPAVATLMSRLRNVQGVTRVSLAKSEKSAVAAGAAGATGPVRQGRTPELRDRRLLREGHRRSLRWRGPPASPRTALPAPRLRPPTPTASRPTTRLPSPLRRPPQPREVRPRDPQKHDPARRGGRCRRGGCLLDARPHA